MKSIEWLKEEVQEKLLEDKLDGINYFDYKRLKEDIWGLIDQLDEPETLSQEWIDNHTASAYTIAHYSEEDVRVIMVSDLENLLVPKQELPEPEVLSDKWIDEHAFGDWDGYVYNEYVSVENLQNLLVPKQEEQEPETVASVIADFYKSLERLKEVLGTEVEELEE